MYYEVHICPDSTIYRLILILHEHFGQI